MYEAGKRFGIGDVSIQVILGIKKCVLDKKVVKKSFLFLIKVA